MKKLNQISSTRKTGAASPQQPTRSAAAPRRAVVKQPAKRRIKVPNAAAGLETTAAGNPAKRAATLPERAAELCNRLAANGQKLPAAARRFFDEMYRAVRKHPKTERVLFVKLTRNQAIKFHASPRGSHLKQFLASASLQQLFPLLGRSPIAWEIDEHSNHKPAPVKLLAIRNPTAEELRPYRLTQARLTARRALVNSEAKRRTDRLAAQAASELRTAPAAQGSPRSSGAAGRSLQK